MEILKNHIVSDKLRSSNKCTLLTLNSKFNVIVSLEKSPLDKIRELFKSILVDGFTDHNHYKLTTYFAEIVDTDTVINVIIDTVQSKLDSIREALDTNEINLSMYIQIWESYHDFFKNMHLIIKNYQNYLMNKNVTVGKLSLSILSIIEIGMFYNSVIKNNPNDILSSLSKHIYSIDKNNIDQLINYIDSIRSFTLVSGVIDIDKIKLFKIIKNIINSPEIINTLCAYLDTLIRSVSFEKFTKNTEYKTVSIDSIKNQTIRKIYKITIILAAYSDRNVLNLCYTKFLQARVINPGYKNFGLEIKLVKIIHDCIGQQEAQKLIKIIENMISNRNNNTSIHNATVENVEGKYKSIGDISTEMLNPVIIDKTVWTIFNNLNIDVQYPLELECYLNIVEKSYNIIYENKFSINWLPTMGTACFRAILGDKNVTITCNILQAIIISLFNDTNNLSASSVYNKTGIQYDLSEKILESLFEANIVTRKYSSNDTVYIVNTHNYTGDTNINIINEFIELFETPVNSSDSSVNLSMDKKSDDSKIQETDISTAETDVKFLGDEDYVDGNEDCISDNEDDKKYDSDIDSDLGDLEDPSEPKLIVDSCSDCSESDSEEY
ncbi:putative cullin-like protein [Acanthamoeba polyphaga mimivirus]|nr:putative cullin-like protein [Mimivirus reunion]WMV61692.1 putative cullin-like protein [Mimivirus sp.]WMV62669.1 putative cullin-like protein [Acanthamoeba polyphaga mimivirus]WMV63646.1 putative cullin-like protein [Mimivirus sp.]